MTLRCLECNGIIDDPKEEVCPHCGRRKPLTFFVFGIPLSMNTTAILLGVAVILILYLLF